MSLKKRGEIWHITFTTPSGKRIRQSAGTKIKREAEELLAKLKNQSFEHERLGIQSGRTWDEAALKWINLKKGTKSYDRNIEKLRYLQEFLKGLPLSKIDADLIEEIGLIKAEETSGSTANRYLAVIRAVMRLAADKWKWIAYAPVIDMFKECDGRIRWITRDEADKLMKELPSHQKAMASFALATGLRQSNVLGLEWSQVNLELKMAWIHPDQAKAKKAIGVPLNDDAIKVLESELGKNDQYVFTYKNKRIKAANTRAWGKALKRAGIEDFRWHDLRHTWASWHVQNGTPLHILKELGGWRTMVMVQRYAHLAPEHLVAYVNNVLMKKAS